MASPLAELRVRPSMEEMDVCLGDFDGVAFSDELEGCFIAVFDVPGGKSGVDPEETGRKER